MLEQSDTPEPRKTTRIVRPAKKTLLLLLAGVLLLANVALIVAAHYLRQPTDRSRFLPSAVYYHRVKRGMTQEEVENACGRPEYAQQKNELGDEAESWYYTASDGAIEIFFDEGKVKLISRE